MNEEQKELALWGGGGLLAILILSWLTASRSAQVSSHNAAVERLYPDYQRYYATVEDDPARLTMTEAQRALEESQARQAAIRQQLEAQLLVTLDPKVINAQRSTPGGGAAFSYNQVVDEVDSRYRALRAKALRLNVGNLPPLPHEGADRIARGDEPAVLQQRALQLAEVLLVDRVLNLLIDMGIHGVSAIEALPPIADQPTEPSYLGLGVQLAFAMDYINADRLQRTLREASGKLDLETLTMSPNAQHNGRFDLQVGFRQLSFWPEDWDASAILEVVPSSGTRAESSPSRSVRGVNRR